MSKYERCIVIKNAELPEEKKYHGLSRDEEYKKIAWKENLGIDMAVVPLTEEERNEILELPQVWDVVVDPLYSKPEPPMLKEDEAQNVSGTDQKSFHGVDYLHGKNIKGQGIKVVVLDTGFDQWHSNNGVTVKGTKDFTGSPSGWYDRDGHGSWCAGAIKDPQEFGYAPECDLYVGKVLGDDGSGYGSWIINGINWAVSQGAHVISMSLGGPGHSQDAMSLAVTAARGQGILVPCAAGNDGCDERKIADHHHPGSALGAICVGAVDKNSNIASFSSCGVSLDIAALGVRVNGLGADGSRNNVISGTSMATPHVAGGCALLLSAGKSAAEVESVIYGTARDTSIDVTSEGHGIMDLKKAYDKLFPSAPPVEPSEYYPRLPRITKWRFYTKFDRGMEQCVLTLRGKDQGRYIPKSEDQ